MLRGIYSLLETDSNPSKCNANANWTPAPINEEAFASSFSIVDIFCKKPYNMPMLTIRSEHYETNPLANN